MTFADSILQTASIARCVAAVAVTPDNQREATPSGNRVGDGVRIGSWSGLCRVVHGRARSRFQTWLRPQLTGAQLIIQGIPNLSTSMPNRSDQKVFPTGITTLPPSASPEKMRSTSSALSTDSCTEKPCGFA